MTNILIFMTDQEQADVILPEHPCLTPNAARLAGDGLLFRQAYCPTAHCCPSRATFFTGLYPSRHGIFNNVRTPTAIHPGLQEGVILFSEPLRQAGYNLAYAGKWHVSGMENPGDRGWDELLVTCGKGLPRIEGHNPGLWSNSPRRRGQLYRPGWEEYRLYGSYPSMAPDGFEDHPDHAVVRAAKEALPRRARPGKPWVLFVGPLGPHDPYLVPERFVEMYQPDAIHLPPSFHDTLADKPGIYRRMRQQIWAQLGEDEVREAIAHYWAYCTMMDEMLGEILTALSATGQQEETLVVFLSDHGDYAGSHGLFLKGVPAFREAYQIPCILRWPKGISKPGRVIDDFVTLADFTPTFLELAGLPVPEGLSGRSLAPFLRGESPLGWRDCFCSQFNGVELYYSQRMVVTKEFKYVYNGFDFDEFYDLRCDPHEMVNVVDHEGYQEDKRRLIRRMWRFAEAESDELIFDSYPAVALAPYGPADEKC